MRIRIDRATLAETLTWVGRVIPRNPAAPVLAGVRLTATDGALTASAFDYESSHSAATPAEVDVDGDVLVSGAYLRTIVSACKGTTITLEASNHELVLTADRATYSTPLMDLADYPHLPDIPAPAGTVPGDQFAAAVSAVRPGCDDNPPSSDLQALAGIRLETSDAGLELATTNRFIILSAAVDWAGEDLAATVPGKVLEGAVKGMTGALSIGLDSGTLSVSDTTRTVTTRVIAAKFPAAIVRAGKLIENKNLDAVTLTIAADEIEIATAEGATARGTDYVTATSTGTAAISFSPRFLSAGLAAMPPGPVSVGVASGTHPFVIRPAGSDDRVSVVMPRKS